MALSSEMRILLTKASPKIKHQDFRHKVVGGEIFITLLCPKHFPENPNSIKGEEGLSRFSRGEISSEVIFKDGKYTLAVNGQDVTSILQNDLEANSDIKIVINESEGEDCPDEAIYKAFGLSELS